MSELDPQVLRAARNATEPTLAEVDALMRGLRREQTPSRLPMLVLGFAAAAAIVLLMLWPSTAQYGPTPTGPVRLTAQHLAFGPSISVTGTGSAVVTAAGPEGTRIELRQGAITATVDPTGAFRALTIATPDGTEVAVRGTVFTVTWDGQAGSVAVARGLVSVTGSDLDTELAAGEQISWNDGATVGEGSRPEPIPAKGEGSGAPDLLDRGDHLPVPRAPAPVIDAAPAPSIAEPDEVPPEPAVVASEPVAALEPDLPAEPNPSPDLAQARAFGRVQQALEDGRAEDAEYLAGLFVERYPDSSLASEASFVAIEAIAVRDPAKAVARASAWLTAHPSHARRIDVLTLHATLSRDRLKDCAAALPSYTELASLTRGSEGARALAYQGLCAADLGDVVVAREALDAALAAPQLPRALAPRVRATRDRLREDTP